MSEPTKTGDKTPKENPLKQILQNFKPKPEVPILTEDRLKDFLTYYQDLPELEQEDWEAYELLTPASFRKTQTAKRVLCRFFQPVGRGRKLVGKKKIPLARASTSFIFKPRGIKTEPCEYFINTRLLDEVDKVFPPSQNLLVADFWLNNPNQIDYSRFGRDMLADGRELAQAHHRFVKKNLLEQDMTIYLVLGMIGMVSMLIAVGYGTTVSPETIHIYTTPDGTQFVYKEGQSVATGRNIAALPAPVANSVQAQEAAQNAR